MRCNRRTPLGTVDTGSFVAPRGSNRRPHLEAIVIRRIRPVVTAIALLVATALHAQSGATATLTGVIVDSTGTGIAGATVVVEPGDTLAARDTTRPRPRATTDATGAFRVEGVPAGAILLVVEHPRYKAVEAAADVAAGVTIALRITLTEVPPPPPEPAPDPAAVESAPRLRGTVTDTAGRPVADADVGYVDGSGTPVRTDSLGRFALPQAEASAAVVRARRLGYRAAYVTRRSVDTSAVTLVLAPVGQQLGTVRVRANWDNRALEAQMQRKKVWGGTHIGREEIERRGAFRVTDVLMGRMGITVRRDASGNGRVLGRLDCPMHVFVNGVHVRNVSLDEIVNATEVMSVEAYNAAVNTPAEFQVLEDRGCGAVAVWTR
jgi:hypothetical protein